MPVFSGDFFHPDYPTFPSVDTALPFHSELHRVFFAPREEDNEDFPIHGPNVVRFADALLSSDVYDGRSFGPVPGLLKASDPQAAEAEEAYFGSLGDLLRFMEVGIGARADKAQEFLKTCALFHDIGKVIRRANHPQIGANLLRNYDDEQRGKLLAALELRSSSDPGAAVNRFSLLTSVVKHHDKFGVVSTGEAGLPIFSDILYFRSEAQNMDGILKNVTAVMLLNLADIAAVCTAEESVRDDALRLVSEIRQIRAGALSEPEAPRFDQLNDFCTQPDNCLGLSYQAITDVLGDWSVLTSAIRAPEVMGDREKLKFHLLEEERNPARTIRRIIRLIKTSFLAKNLQQLADLVSVIAIETILVDSVGAFRVQEFCDQFATVVKLDYGLGFFRALAAVCAKKRIRGIQVQRILEDDISTNEMAEIEGLPRSAQQLIVEEMSVLTVRILISLVSRYSGVVGATSGHRRFGFELKTLSSDPAVLQAILKALCLRENKAVSGLAWICDEVTIWSMD